MTSFLFSIPPDINIGLENVDMNDTFAKELPEDGTDSVDCLDNLSNLAGYKNGAIVAGNETTNKPNSAGDEAMKLCFFPTE